MQGVAPCIRLNHSENLSRGLASQRCRYHQQANSWLTAVTAAIAIKQRIDIAVRPTWVDSIKLAARPS
jgi:hypothetical protein